MFCNTNIINSEILGKVWKLAHNLPIVNIKTSNLPNICKELDSWVSSESVMATRRLSLRASSNLVAGAAKLFNQSLDKLLDDAYKMDEDLIYRRKRDRHDSSSSENPDSTAESFIEDPEQMRRPVTVGFVDSSFSPTKRRRTVNTTENLTMSRSSSGNLSAATNSNEKSNHNQSFIDDNLDTENMGQAVKSSSEVGTANGEEPLAEEENHQSQHKDQGVPTSPIIKCSRINRGTNTNSRIKHGINGNIPFGYVFIHDNNDFRIPSRIIFTSINSDVYNLI